MDKQLPESMLSMIEKVHDCFSDDEKIRSMFASCFSNTYETTIRPQEDGTTFVITGDIPAMWPRDSAAQVRSYLVLAEEDEQIADMIQGVIQKHMEYINHDPYANAFNEKPTGDLYTNEFNEKLTYYRLNNDKTEMSPLIWERKYEIDSLCYPIQLAYLFWKSTGRTSHFNETFKEAVQNILKVWEIEQNHAEDSSYSFIRHNCQPQDTLSHDGKGAPVKYTGMTWCGFRPSDDACQYPYLIPANMFAV